MTEPEHDDHDDAVTADDPPPGPADHGRTGGMVTRQAAPDVAKPIEEPPD